MSKYEQRLDPAGVDSIPPPANRTPAPPPPSTGGARVDQDGYEREETDGGATGTAVGRRRQYHTSLEAAVIDELDELGRAAGLSRAAMIRVAVVDGLPLVRARFRAVR